VENVLAYYKAGVVAVNLKALGLAPGHPGTNPTTLSFNASVVKIYSATNSMTRFYNENYFLRRKNAVAYYSAGVVAENSKVVGLPPGHPGCS
jgi:hypothetical protein